MTRTALVLVTLVRGEAGTGGRASAMPFCGMSPRHMPSRTPCLAGWHRNRSEMVEILRWERSSPSLETV